MRRGLILLMLLSGCVASPPGSSVFTDDGGTDGMPDLTPAIVTEITPPSIDPMPTSTDWMTVKVSGRGPKSGRVLIDTPLAGAVAAETGSDGIFCIDVDLTPDALNNFKARSIGADGQISTTIEFAVSQHGIHVSTPGVPMASHNVAIGAYAKIHDMWVLDNYFSFDNPSPTALAPLVDDSITTAVDFRASGDPVFPHKYIWLTLAVPNQRINQIVVNSPSMSMPACSMKAFELYATNVASPGEPPRANDPLHPNRPINPSDPNCTPGSTEMTCPKIWKSLSPANKGPGIDEASFPAMEISHVAVVLDDSKPSCEVDWSTNISWVVNEIKAMTEAYSPPAPDRGPSCNGG